MTDQTADLRSSKSWTEKLNAEFPGVVVLDPDGWDRKNYDHSFNIQEISWKTFLERVMRSTVQAPFKQLFALERAKAAA
jgi:chorismate mutase